MDNNLEKPPMSKKNIETTPDPKKQTKQELNSLKAETEAEAKRAEERKDIIDRLNNAADSKARVHIFGKLVDSYGLEALLSLIPGLGDGTSSAIAGLYLVYEAKEAGLSTVSYLKIIGLQTADFFVGAIPVVGDAADFLFQATNWSESSFQKNIDKLVEEAKEKGIPEEDIKRITESADKIPNLVDKVFVDPLDNIMPKKG